MKSMEILVTVGDDAVVGARSSVSHDLLPMMVCVSRPAKLIKPRVGRPACES